MATFSMILPRSSDCYQKTADALPQFAGQVERLSFLFGVAEPRTLHLLCGGAESFATDVVHGNEAECLGKRRPVRSHVQELDLRFYCPKHRVQNHLGQRFSRYSALSKDGRTSGKGEPFDNSDEVLTSNGE